MRQAFVCSCLLAGLLAGCTRQQLRLQSEDDDKKEDKAAKVKTIGDVTSVFGLVPVRVYGIGVVTGLKGNGREPEPGEFRRAALHYLKQEGIDDPVAFLASGDVAVVQVSAEIPPGAQDDSRIDAVVELPPRDKTLSLQGGVLQEVDLREYADVNQMLGQGSGQNVRRGRVLAKAAGPVLVGLGDVGARDADRTRGGRVWQGAKVLHDRTLALMLTKDNQTVDKARTVAERINESFHGPFRGTLRGMAEPKNNTTITLRVSPRYRHNLERYLRVIRHMPLRESPAGRARHQKDVAQQLLKPGTTLVAALKLEALGKDAVDDLKRGLTSEHPLVRFCSAEALAYLGDPACARPLAELIEAEPKFRAYGLAALASLDAAICHLKLRELLAANSAETRYGAFRALRELDANDQAVAGEFLNNSYYLHVVAPGSTPLAHVSSVRRAEIVLFGEEPMLTPPFTLEAGPEFTVVASAGDERCVVGRFSASSGVHREPCSLRVEDVIRTLSGMGASYADAVDLLRQAASSKSLSCPLAVDALPRATAVYNLALDGVRDQADAEAEKSESVDLGGLPNLFSMPSKKPPADTRGRAPR